MKQYIARQPIFNVHKKLYAYELLYRGNVNDNLSNVSGNKATASLLSSAFLTKDIDDISSHRPCFINFTQDLIEKNLPAAFPKAKIVVEILEDVEPTKKVLAVCRSLHEKGYTIALDDFVYERRFEPFLEFAHIVKIDVRLTPLNTLTRTLNILARHKVKLLAEKVETLEEFEKANRMGFAYYQGYFFCKPERIGITELSSVKVTLLRLLAEVVKKNTNIERLRDIIVTDVAISYKLLRFMNSAYFYRLQEVKSIQHAVAYLGEKELRRFVMLVIISELTTEKPEEIIRHVLVRARFCEKLGEKLYERDVTSELFLMGLFSLLDAMLDSPMREVLDKLPISDRVKKALLYKTNKFAKFLKIAIAFERNQEEVFSPLIKEFGLEDQQVQESYLEAVKYANHLL
jgi:c-di-GMP-related signal transduction protein